MVVHSRLYRIVLILGKRIGSERYYRYIGFFAVVYPAYLGCGLIAVHYRHLDIHKDNIIVIIGRFLQHFHTVNAVFGSFDYKALIRQQFGCYFGIYIIILGQKHSSAFKGSLVNICIGTFCLCFLF